jgi:hypothetical protein
MGHDFMVADWRRETEKKCILIFLDKTEGSRRIQRARD